jgi:hypothetical protein
MVLPRLKKSLALAAVIAPCMAVPAWADEFLQPAPIPTLTLAEATPAQPPGAAPATPAAPAAEAAAPNYPPGLFMDALGPVKKPMDDLGLRVYGWVEAGFTGHLSGGQHPLPMMLFESIRPNNLHLQQLRLTFDRPYDSGKNVDFGFRMDGMLGIDSLFTHSLGMFDKAGHGQSDAWADMTQGYVQGWIKTGKESGLEITAGKFVTPFGAEVIDATGNALFSHSDLFNFAIPFAHTGVKLNYIINPQVSVYVGAVEGWDITEDNNDSWSEMAGFSLNSAEQIEGHARGSLALNFITGPEQKDNVGNYRTVVDLVGIWWWTGKLSQTLNFDYGTEAGANAKGNGAHWYGVAHYLTYAWNDYAAPTWRVEWFADPDGVRTGTAANYYETTFGVSLTPFPKHTVWKTLMVRPELRWDWADREAFGDDHHNQLTAGVDVIFKF